MQDDKAGIEDSLKQMQDAFDNADRSRAFGVAEGPHEQGGNLLELKERLQGKEKSFQAQERFIREQQLNLGSETVSGKRNGRQGSTQNRQRETKDGTGLGGFGALFLTPSKKRLYSGSAPGPRESRRIQNSA